MNRSGCCSNVRGLYTALRCTGYVSDIVMKGGQFKLACLSLNILQMYKSGLRSARRTWSEAQQQVCNSRMVDTMEDSEDVVVLTGVGQAAGLPVWLEAKLRMSDPQVRELRLSRGQTLPSGMVAHEAARLRDLLGEAVDDLESLYDSALECELNELFDTRGVGIKMVLDKLRAVSGLARGLVAGASQVYRFDEDFDRLGLVRDDGGMRTNTAVGAANARQEAARCGLGTMASRKGTIYSCDLGVSSVILADTWLKVRLSVRYDCIVELFLSTSRRSRRPRWWTRPLPGGTRPWRSCGIS